MAGKETWDVNELKNLSGFTAALQDYIQALEQDYDIKITDLMINVKAIAPKLSVPWGIISFSNPEDTTLQFEAGEFEIGIS